MKKIIRIDYHTVAFVCSHIFENTKDVLYVCKADGDWQFLCGDNHDLSEKPRVIGIGHLLERDPTLHKIINLKDDWEAERVDIQSEWKLKKCQ
jgi:hypothetical protein